MSPCTATFVAGGHLPSCELGMRQPCFQPQTWWDTLPHTLPLAPIVFMQGTHCPPPVLCQLGTPMLTLIISSFELWGPSPPTQLFPYPQLSAQVDSVPHPSTCHPSTCSFLTNLALWSHLLPHGWLHLGWRSSKPSGKGRGGLIQHFSHLLHRQAKVPLLPQASSPSCCSRCPSAKTGGAS